MQGALGQAILLACAGVLTGACACSKLGYLMSLPCLGSADACECTRGPAAARGLHSLSKTPFQNKLFIIPNSLGLIFSPSFSFLSFLLFTV